jgi:hypothetical protein
MLSQHTAISRPTLISTELQCRAVAKRHMQVCTQFTLGCSVCCCKATMQHMQLQLSKLQSLQCCTESVFAFNTSTHTKFARTICCLGRNQNRNPRPQIPQFPPFPYYFRMGLIIMNGVNHNERAKDAPPVNLFILFYAYATEHATRSNYQSAAATAAAHQVLPCRCREHSRTVQPADAAALTGQACDLAQARGIDANRRTANLPCKYNGAMPLKKKRPN